MGTCFPILRHGRRGSELEYHELHLEKKHRSRKSIATQKNSKRALQPSGLTLRHNGSTWNRPKIG
jgi:hypothetical protein